MPGIIFSFTSLTDGISGASQEISWWTGGAFSNAFRGKIYEALPKNITTVAALFYSMSFNVKKKGNQKVEMWMWWSDNSLVKTKIHTQKNIPSKILLSPFLKFVW